MTFKKDYNELLLYLLDGLVNDALHFEEIVSGSTSGLTHIDVKIEELQHKSPGVPVRVQSLSQNRISTVPPQYIQPPEHRPNLGPPATAAAATSANVPLIDLSLFSSSHSTDLLLEISRACKEWGSFQVVNHGIPTRLLDDMRNVGLSFFNDCDVSEKLKYSCDPSSAASEGYGTRMLVNQNHDTVLDWRDYFDHHTFPLSRRNPSRWPNILQITELSYWKLKISASEEMVESHTDTFRG
ncbi:hypothetical protein Ancab_002887 [Ancistrocladus abbreviatus]